VFYLKCTSNYSSICKLLWHQYNLIKELFSSYFLFVRKNLLNTFTVDIHRHLEGTHTLPLSRRFVISWYIALCSMYFLVRKCITKFFTKSIKWFQCKVLLKNEHIFCSWIHHVLTCTAFMQLVWAAAWHPGWPWLVMGEIGRVYCVGVDLLLV
jgi:hypothetical protein